MDPPPGADARLLRHDLRGQLNTLILCASVIRAADTDKDRIQFLRSIEAAADKIVTLLDRLEALPDGFTEPSDQP